jgi:hypothetical protein
MMTAHNGAGRPELRDALARVNIQVLAAGIVLQVALMPIIVSAGPANPKTLAATFALDAICFLSMAMVRSARRKQVAQRRLSSILAHAVRNVIGHGV